MSSYEDAVKKYLQTPNNRPLWDPHLPDELCAHITTMQDFVAFLKFANANLESELFEYGCEDTDRFIERLSKELEDERFLVHAEEKGIQTDLGRIALAMIFSWGN